MSVYAFSDLHGRYDLWLKILDYVSPEDWLISLGDNIDRGSAGYKLWESIWGRNRTISLMGNHERMAVDAIPFLSSGRFYIDSVNLWFSNGGNETWSDIEGRGQSNISNFLWTLRGLNQSFIYVNKNNQKIILDHAGFTLGLESNAKPLWDREHFYDKWPSGDEVLNADKTFIIHGHTPVQYMYKKYCIHNKDGNNFDGINPNICRYCDGHKFNIDLGSFASGRVALLDLDTFEVKYFEAENNVRQT